MTSHSLSESEIADAITSLYVPEMGTDVMAPLLYQFLRFTRARTVLEAGMGYTTPFLARALRDNAAAFRAEKAAMIAKCDAYVRELDAMDEAARIPAGEERMGLAAVYAPKTSPLADRRTRWMFEGGTALLHPGYYLDERQTGVVCVDNEQSSASSVRRVEGVLDTIGLRDYVMRHTGNFWSCDFAALAQDHLPFDLIWIDVPVSFQNAMSLVRGPHWELLNPNGGLLIVHDMLNHEGGQMLVREVFQAEQRERFDEFEFVSMLEPQRVIQNSFVMIRNRTGVQEVQIERQFTAPHEADFEAAARELVRRK